MRFRSVHHPIVVGTVLSARFGLTRERNVENVEDWEPGVAPDIPRFSIYI